ncbi:hypothetical protein L1Q15_27300, partial [Klebsiella pneumoniae]
RLLPVHSAFFSVLRPFCFPSHRYFSGILTHFINVVFVAFFQAAEFWLSQDYEYDGVILTI